MNFANRIGKGCNYGAREVFQKVERTVEGCFGGSGFGSLVGVVASVVLTSFVTVPLVTIGILANLVGDAAADRERAASRANL